jgi:ferredoxin
VDCLIRFVPSDKSLRVPEGTNLLDAVKLAGLPLARACDGHGLCARCGIRILANSDPLPVEDAEEQDAMLRNEIDRELRLACKIELCGDLTVTAPYW